jgi:hypothetical protein
MAYIFDPTRCGRDLRLHNRGGLAGAPDLDQDRGHRLPFSGPAFDETLKAGCQKGHRLHASLPSVCGAGKQGNSVLCYPLWRSGSHRDFATVWQVQAAEIAGREHVPAMDARV